MSNYLQVVIGVVVKDGELLVAQRRKHQHQGGKWEFPGGKVESGETAGQALIRELQEEVGITPTQMRPLGIVEHHYPDLSVQLDTWLVSEFQGAAEGCESQKIEWVSMQKLQMLDVPEANQRIVEMLQSLWVMGESPRL